MLDPHREVLILPTIEWKLNLYTNKHPFFVIAAEDDKNRAQIVYVDQAHP